MHVCPQMWSTRALCALGFSFTINGSAMVLGCLGIMAVTSDVRANKPEPGQVFLDNLSLRWTERLGLWRNVSKHDLTRHDIRFNARVLVQAGNMRVLDRVPAEQVLSRLRQAQAGEGPRRGNFWWSWEDGEVTDSNSGFFTTLQLLALHHHYRDQLSPLAQAHLDHMLDAARHWFDNKVYPITERKLRYPNAYFGDFVCLWLLSERDGSVNTDLANDLQRVIDYYLEEKWGWGEHLSDIYAKVLQEQLLAMLMWADDVSPDARSGLEQMMYELAFIEAAFAGGPRVPAMRNALMLDQSMTGTRPEARNNATWDHGKTLPELAAAATPDVTNWTLIRLAGLHAPNLVERFSLPRVPSQAVEIPCHDNIAAQAWVDERWRIGVMSYYPIFDDMLGKPSHGLGIQDIPVAFWHERGDWVYLQWAALENGRERALPAVDYSDARRQGLARLSDEVPQACLAETLATRVNREFLVLRRLPHVAGTWEVVSDRLRLADVFTQWVNHDQSNGWHRLTLGMGDETLTVAYRPLNEVAMEVSLHTVGGEQYWGPRWSVAPQREAETLIGLWYMTVAPDPVTPPVVDASGEYEIVVSLGGEGQMMIDPSSQSRQAWRRWK